MKQTSNRIMSQTSLPNTFYKFTNFSSVCLLIILLLLSAHQSCAQTTLMTSQGVASHNSTTTEVPPSSDKTTAFNVSTAKPAEAEDMTNYDDVIHYDAVDDYAMTSQFEEEGSSEFDEVTSSPHGGQSQGRSLVKEDECGVVNIQIPSSALNLQCQHSKRKEEEDEKQLMQKAEMKKLYDHVIEAKGGIEVMKKMVENNKDDIMMQFARYPDVQQIKEAITTITRLKQETSNSNERVNQLYLQLMHEIINKRDHQLDYEKLTTKILEQKSAYHELQESVTLMENKLREMEIDKMNQASKIKVMEGEQLRMKEEIKVLQQICSSGSSNSRFELQIDEDQPIRSPYDPNNQLERRETNEDNNRLSRDSSKRTHSSALAHGHFIDCTHAQQHGYKESGIYRIKLPGERKSVKVWCDFDLDPGGWIIIQRRIDGKTDFNRGMEMYKKGFGRVKSEYWIGLDILHRLTNNSNLSYKLHVELEDWNRNRRFAEYEGFRVLGEDRKYQLNIAHYSGNAGDSMTRNNHMRFSTKDEDNDLSRQQNCAVNHEAGWWFNSCGDSNLNGKYHKQGNYRSDVKKNGIYWSSWRPDYSLRSVVMMIRPNN